MCPQPSPSRFPAAVLLPPVLPPSPESVSKLWKLSGAVRGCGGGAASSLLLARRFCSHAPETVQAGRCAPREETFSSGLISSVCLSVLVCRASCPFPLAPPSGRRWGGEKTMPQCECERNDPRRARALVWLAESNIACFARPSTHTTPAEPFMLSPDPAEVARSTRDFHRDQHRGVCVCGWAARQLAPASASFSLWPPSALCCLRRLRGVLYHPVGRRRMGMWGA
jgi:hypothetical protein